MEGGGRGDTLALFFHTLFSAHHLVDFVPDLLTPTWRNGREGAASISKRLDRFLLSEHLISPIDRLHTWVCFPFFSDHAPIALHLETASYKIAFPFKLNADWLTEPDFNTIVAEVWRDNTFLSEQCIQSRIAWKLRCLKGRIKR